jgi:uncharacterized lipoprotein YmbA
MMRSARKTKARLSVAMAFLLAITAGCAHSPPTRYVTLSAEPAAAPRATPLQPVQLTAVHIPAELDRPEVVTQDAANQLTVHDNDRWGAPLAQLMRRTLAQDLLARLPASTFILPDAPAPPGTRALVVTVLNSEADASGTLTLQVSWALLSGHPSHAMQTQQLTLTANMASHDATAQAAALSQLLGQLADRIAASIAAR